MEPSSFCIHDVSAFPIVHFESGAAIAGYAPQWCEEMNALIARNQPFVLIYRPRVREEAHEDRVKRGAWLKRNKAALSGKCLGLIVIESDATRRAELEAMFPNLVRAFGTPQATRPTVAEAEALAQHILAGGLISGSDNC